MPATYCIICGKQKSGLPVRDDHVLAAIRWFKRNITKNEQKNKLVVCKEDYPTYKKNRDKYNVRLLIYVGAGAIFLIISIVLYFSATTILISLGLLAFLYLMSLLSYTPGLKLDSNSSLPTKHNQ